MKMRIPIICLVFSAVIIGVCLFAMGEAAQSEVFLPAMTVSDTFGSQATSN